MSILEYSHITRLLANQNNEQNIIFNEHNCNQNYNDQIVIDKVDEVDLSRKSSHTTTTTHHHDPQNSCAQTSDLDS